MKLHIANLGAVKEATIDLSRKLTVFCGPNGTGKTWVAYVVHGFLTARRAPVYRGPVPDADLLSAGDRAEIEIQPDSAYEALQGTIQALKSNIQSVLPIPVSRQQELFGSFDIGLVASADSFARNLFDQEIETAISFLGMRIAIRKPSKSHYVQLWKLSGKSLLPLRQIYAPLLMNSVVRSLALYPFESSSILPVERNSVFTFCKELGLQKQRLVDQLQDINHTTSEKELADFLDGRTTRYPQAIREALDVADDIFDISKTASIYYEFGLEAEQFLLKGRVDIGSDGEVSFSPNSAADKNFSFQLSSSAVKTLSSLIVYLKYQAKPNDLLIIDEPELNLHPDNQILLARIFARMINLGMRLLISTHSDYIVRELNNLIMLSADEPALKKVAQEYGYRDDERISKGDIGVYLFRFKEAGEPVVVEPVEVSDSGFEVATIEQTIKRLNEAAEEIYYTMKYGEQVRDEQD